MMTFENILKERVTKALEAKLGVTVALGHREWEDAKGNALRDIYINKICFLEAVTPDDFTNVMVNVLYCSMSISA